MLSNFFRTFLLLILSTFLVAKEERTPLEYLNEIRQKSGLIPLQVNDSLTKAANAHARYLVRHQKMGHLQQKGYKNYTGKTPADRVIFHGYPSKDVMENLSVNAKNDRASINDLFAAIYHRFVFLSFDKNEIGIGEASTKKSKGIKKVHVYNLGSSMLRSLCKKSFIPIGGVEYMQNTCKKTDTLIPRTLYEKNRSKINFQNPKVLFHPYPGQKEVVTVFYNETPDPLPDYKVSGYPVSVQFNDLFHHSIHLKTFRLFDEKEKEVMMTRILTHESDPHQMLKKTQFALMPIKRLEYGTTYTVYFKANVDGKPYEKSWKFTTRGFKEKLYSITEKKTVLDIEEEKSIILYFVPATPNDILKQYKASDGIEISLIDQNTMKVTLEKKSGALLQIDVSGRVVLFK